MTTGTTPTRLDGQVVLISSAAGGTGGATRAAGVAADCLPQLLPAAGSTGPTSG
jgi:hypothetical protein